MVETIGTKAVHKPRSHTVKVIFVPITLHPSNPAHVEEIREANGIEPGKLVAARWAKPPSRRSENQRTATLLLTLTDPELANGFVARGIYICNRRLDARRDKKRPTRCLKCNYYDHMAKECLAKEDTCGTCGANGHRTNDCTSTGKVFCVSCGLDDHPSWANHCPVFLRKSEDLDRRHPENGLPFFPTRDPWTFIYNDMTANLL